LRFARVVPSGLLKEYVFDIGASRYIIIILFLTPGVAALVPRALPLATELLPLTGLLKEEV
jgi:hypothetical protein